MVDRVVVTNVIITHDRAEAVGRRGEGVVVVVLLLIVLVLERRRVWLEIEVVEVERKVVVGGANVSVVPVCEVAVDGEGRQVLIAGLEESST